MAVAALAAGCRTVPISGRKQFVVLTDQQMARLGRDVAFSFWEKLPDGRTVVRFATSWATRPEDVSALRELL